ncbi:MAG TPA: hypothetical protein VK106_00680, partial [Balneolaceae bacterium]|nr:hypothetical protein [Balneolaceae bacterium]
ESKQVSCSLVYPCKKSTWTSLVERGRHIHSAEINRGHRKIKLHLSAIPFAMEEKDLKALYKLF